MSLKIATLVIMMVVRLFILLLFHNVIDSCGDDNVVKVKLQIRGATNPALYADKASWINNAKIKAPAVLPTFKSECFSSILQGTKNKGIDDRTKEKLSLFIFRSSQRLTEFRNRMLDCIFFSTKQPSKYAIDRLARQGKTLLGRIIDEIPNELKENEANYLKTIHLFLAPEVFVLFKVKKYCFFGYFSPPQFNSRALSGYMNFVKAIDDKVVNHNL